MRRWVVVGAVAMAMAAGSPALAAGKHAPAKANPPRAADAAVGYQDGAFNPLPFYPFAPNNHQSPTADKAQSKVWWAAGSWWAVMLTSGSPGSVNIFRLSPGHTWDDTGVVVDDRAASTADVLWTAGHLYVVSRSYVTGIAQTRYNRFEFNPLTQAFVRSVGPVTVAKSNAESASIARGDDGVLWVTVTKNGKVWVAHTVGANDQLWVPPYRPIGDTLVSLDDISTVVRLPGGIGVFWSDQASDVFRFFVHRNGFPDSEWIRETAYSGLGIADDHMSVRSLVTDTGGRVYAAVKTSRDKVPGSDPSDPQFLLLTRSPVGDWSSSVVATLGDDVSRPSLVLDVTNAQLHLFFTVHPSDGGSIWEKSAPFGDQPIFAPGIGVRRISRPGADINDPSTIKTAVNSVTGLLVLASDAGNGRYYHAELPI